MINDALIIIISCCLMLTTVANASSNDVVSPPQPQTDSVVFTATNKIVDGDKEKIIDGDVPSIGIAVSKFVKGLSETNITLLEEVTLNSLINDEKFKRTFLIYRNNDTVNLYYSNLFYYLQLSIRSRLSRSPLSATVALTANRDGKWYVEDVNFRGSSAKSIESMNIDSYVGLTPHVESNNFYELVKLLGRQSNPQKHQSICCTPTLNSFLTDSIVSVEFSKETANSYELKGVITYPVSNSGSARSRINVVDLIFYEYPIGNTDGQKHKSGWLLTGVRYRSNDVGNELYYDLHVNRKLERSLVPQNFRLSKNTKVIKSGDRN